MHELTLCHGWNACGLLASPGDQARPIEIVNSVLGLATVDKDTIAIIGSQRRPTRQLSFTLGSFEDWNTVSEKWQRDKIIWGDPLRDLETSVDNEDGQRFLQYLRIVYAQFEERPPTIWLGFSKADCELGNKDEWQLSCEVPRPVLNALATDISNGKCDRLDVLLTLAPTLVDNEHAPPSVPVTLGILRLGKYDGGSSRGWIERVSWRIPAAVRAVSETDLEGATDDSDSADESQSHDTMNSDRQAPPNELTVVHSEIQLLSRTVRNRFVLILVLLAIIVILR